MPITIYPATLKYKNSQGTFQNADCLKGDKGDTYTLTNADKQEIAGYVDYNNYIETITGTTPSITGLPNYRYKCGEVSTISITPPSTGTIDVIFSSGSTATTMTVPNTVKWPAWFDATALEANTTYEILITDGVYGAVMTWEA